MEQKIIDYPFLRKVDKSYIINKDNKGYQDALVRRNNINKIKELEDKITEMFQQIQNIKKD